jgi:hypothetical protein
MIILTIAILLYRSFACFWVFPSKQRSRATTCR